MSGTAARGYSLTDIELSEPGADLSGQTPLRRLTFEVEHGARTAVQQRQCESFVSQLSWLMRGIRAEHEQAKHRLIQELARELGVFLSVGQMWLGHLAFLALGFFLARRFPEWLPGLTDLLKGGDR